MLNTDFECRTCMFLVSTAIRPRATLDGFVISLCCGFGVATVPGAPDVRTASAAPPPPVVSGRSGDSDGTGCARVPAEQVLL